MTKSQKIRLFILLFPVAICLLLILQAENRFRHAKVWHVPITGYDPRDLLYGHYINFQFDTAKMETKCHAGTTGTCALCLRGDKNNLQLSIIPALPRESVKATCQGWVVEGENKFVILGSNRFLLDESKALRVEHALRARWGSDFVPTAKVVLELMTTDSGAYRFNDLLIDGVRVKDLAQ